MNGEDTSITSRKYLSEKGPPRSHHQERTHNIMVGKGLHSHVFLRSGIAGPFGIAGPRTSSHCRSLTWSVTRSINNNRLNSIDTIIRTNPQDLLQAFRKIETFPEKRSSNRSIHDWMQSARFQLRGGAIDAVDTPNPSNPPLNLATPPISAPPPPLVFFFLTHYSRAGLTYGEAMGRALKAYCEAQKEKKKQ